MNPKGFGFGVVKKPIIKGHAMHVISAVQWRRNGAIYCTPPTFLTGRGAVSYTTGTVLVSKTGGVMP